jgi:hypothetical protein
MENHQENMLTVSAPHLEWIALNDAIHARLEYLRKYPHETHHSTIVLLTLVQQRIISRLSNREVQIADPRPPTPENIVDMLTMLNQAKREAAKVAHDEAAWREQDKIFGLCWDWLSSNNIVLDMDSVTGEWVLNKRGRRR